VASDKIKSRSVREYFVAQIPTVIIIVSGRIEHRIARKHFLAQFLTNATLMFVIAHALLPIYCHECSRVTYHVVFFSFIWFRIPHSALRLIG
jgi:hypothetical protein